ncbi:Uncharacterised protein [Serratia proteamaculans]|nr:Uncharacterised protein [Serratia proteamaculans]
MMIFNACGCVQDRISPAIQDMTGWRLIFFVARHQLALVLFAGSLDFFQH